VAQARDKLDCLSGSVPGSPRAASSPPTKLDTIDAEVAALIDRSVAEAKAAPKPAAAELLTDVYVSVLKGLTGMARSISYREAINEALAQEMERDSRVVVFGEDNVGGTGAPVTSTPGAVSSASPRACTASSLGG